MMAAASTIAAVAAIAGTVLSTVGSIRERQAAQAQGQFQAAVQEQQARFQRQQAERERELASLQEAQLRRQQSRDLASARARLAAAGRDAASGSALLLQEDAAAQNEFTALLNRSVGLERAHALENQANLSSLRASEVRFRNAVARQQDRLAAGTSLLRGTSSFFGSFGPAQ